MPSITCARVTHVGALLHQLGDGAAVARAFENEIGNQRHGLRMVELDAALEPAPRHHRGHSDQELVFFARREVHRHRPCSKPASIIRPQPRQRHATQGRQYANQIAAQRGTVGRDQARERKPVPRRDADFSGEPVLHRADCGSVGIIARNLSTVAIATPSPATAALRQPLRDGSVETRDSPQRLARRRRAPASDRTDVPEARSRPWPTGRTR